MKGEAEPPDWAKEEVELPASFAFLSIFRANVDTATTAAFDPDFG